MLLSSTKRLAVAVLVLLALALATGLPRPCGSCCAGSGRGMAVASACHASACHGSAMALRPLDQDAEMVATLATVLPARDGLRCSHCALTTVARFPEASWVMRFTANQGGRNAVLDRRALWHVVQTSALVSRQHGSWDRAGKSPFARTQLDLSTNLRV